MIEQPRCKFRKPRCKFRKLRLGYVQLKIQQASLFVRKNLSMKFDRFVVFSVLFVLVWFLLLTKQVNLTHFNRCKHPYYPNYKNIQIFIEQTPYNHIYCVYNAYIKLLYINELRKIHVFSGQFLRPIFFIYLFLLISDHLKY